MQWFIILTITADFKYFNIFQNELLRRPLRRMLKEDAFPTIFAYNGNEQPSKFRASILREEAVTKKNFVIMLLYTTNLCKILNSRLTLKQPKHFKVTNK